MFEAIQGPMYAAGLVNLDVQTIGIQAVVFLIFATMLNILVIQPMLRTHKTRFDRMQGAREEAEKMDLRAAEAHGQYEDKISAARQDAVALRDQLKEDAEAQAREVVDQATGEANRNLEAGRVVLSEDLEKARGQVDDAVEDLAQMIAANVLSGTEGAS